ncbi:hypothetical protein GCM10007989_25350 [Devosia pacifica]|uniref:VWFA domain-containing protein n=1 Tax=Devosia pacifica TaxID=1335967 RepID=A0A918S9S8_9HYPH|nr:VWA domain-containing protein [Devosia pacifica]GHA28239.1 hypothetical protein GCM10007989_25350 [Devosia pacifica]
MTQHRHDDDFKDLASIEVPPPRADARRQAIDAARTAFAAEAEKNSDTATQGSWLTSRLKSIAGFFERFETMDMRIPLGTAAIALLVFPVSYYLIDSGTLDLRGLVPDDGEAVEDVAAPEPVPATPAEPQEEVASAPAADAEAPPALVERAEERQEPIQLPAQAQPSGAQQQQRMQQSFAQSYDSAAQSMPPSPAPMAAPQGMAPQPSGDQFAEFEESGVHAVVDDPVSTFSVDVDTASYAYVRRMVEQGMVPPPDAVRIEEMINYFSYDYPTPDDPAVPFSTSVSVFPTPWNESSQLMQIGIRGYVPPADDLASANLVFLIDSSGSMQDPDKLPLLKRAFRLLIGQLSEADTISIVTYAGAAGVVLPPTPASEQARILSALDGLEPGGSTAGADGIALAYQLAEEAYIDDGINRVILATDGDFNVGLSDPDALEDFIAGKRDSGVFLSVLGFGSGNLGDDTMQSLAQNGNGTASYISDFREARKVLVAELGGTLETIAKDVKIQVEFNPATVSEYRLIGYETRALAREDFNNDRVDAGDIGAGHTVTALYEIVPVGSDGGLIDPLRYADEPAPAATSDELGLVRLRYKLPDADDSRLIEVPVGPDSVINDLAVAPDDARFAAAVAAFGQKLKGSDYAGDMSWTQVADLARSARGEDAAGYRSEFVQLVETAAVLDAAN